MDIFLISKKGLARWDDWDIPYGCSLNLIIARSLPCWQQFGTLLEIWHRFWHSFTSMLTWHFKKKEGEGNRKQDSWRNADWARKNSGFIYLFFIFLSGATVFNPFVVIWNKTKSWFPLIFQSNFCFILFQKKKFRNMEKSNF